MARLVVLAALTVGALFLSVSPAFAHAVLEHSSPDAGSVVQQPPRELSLSFGEGVIAASQAVRLYDDRLRPVPIGAIRHLQGRGNLIAADVPGSLHPGTYTVTWRVTSADTHVVSGSFTFSVRHPTPVSGVPPAVSRDATTAHLAAIARGLAYAGLVAGPGALVVIAWLWPVGMARRRIRYLLAGGGVLLLVATLGSVVLQGADASGVTLRHGFSGSSLQLGMAGRFGRAVGARVVLLVALAELAILGSRRGRLAATRISLVFAALAATWPYAGHSGSGSLAPLAFLADWVHIAAMATWLGGLAMLLLGPLAAARRVEGQADSSAVTAAFSEWALNAVTLLVATGLFSAWRNVRDVGALTATHYGRLLLWKTGVVVALLVIARASRRHAERLDRTAGAPLPPLRRAVAVEAFGAAVVLGITGFLTGTPPASQTYAPAVTRSATSDGVTVTVHVDRTGVGASGLVVTAIRAGSAQRITEIEGSLTETDPPVGPLPITFSSAGVGREVSTVTFPNPGDWSLALHVQTSSITAIAVTTTIHVR